MRSLEAFYFFIKQFLQFVTLIFIPTFVTLNEKRYTQEIL